MTSTKVFLYAVLAYVAAKTAKAAVKGWLGVSI